MQQRHLGVATALVERRQGVGEPLADGVRVLHEGFHLGLAEGCRVGAGESAAEALNTGHTEPAARQVEHYGVALEHSDPPDPSTSATASGRPS